MKFRNILSLFNGMSCLDIALREANISYNIYYSSEIDKFANQQTQFNFPNTIQLGDVTRWKEWDLDWSKIDFIGAGSPCQGFSFAGKQLAFSDIRSKLFFVFIDILNHARKYNPNVLFLLENVDMKKEYLRIISEYCGVFPVNINSNLVSAQNRNRWYWTNIKVKQVGLFDELYTDIPQPKDEGILLRDILDKDADEKYYIKSDSMLKFVTDDWRLNKKYTQINGEKGLTQQARQYSSWCGDYVCVASRGRGENNEQQLEPTKTDKTNCLSTVSKDNLIMQINPCLESGGKQPYQQNRIYDIDGITPALCANKSDLLIKNEFRIRRLTPNECSKLQTIPGWYKWIIGDSQIYKLLGNGWTCKVIVHILNQIQW